MTLTLAMPVDAKPVCADPKWLPLVDAAFKRPGGPAAHMLAEVACAECPVVTLCLAHATIASEHGLWGGTSPHLRRRRGSRQPSSAANMAGVNHGRDARTDRTVA